MGSQGKEDEVNVSQEKNDDRWVEEGGWAHDENGFRSSKTIIS